MRTKLSIILAALALAMLAPGAGASTTRTATLDYVIPNGLNTSAYTTGWTVNPVRPDMTIPLDDDETTVSISVEDAGGGDVWVGVAYDMTTAARFCTATGEPFQVPSGEDIRLTLFVGTCDDGTLSTPTAGTITAEIS